jgi:Arc/MetJ-type ribon-helix-helix transcriptional regulator
MPNQSFTCAIPEIYVEEIAKLVRQGFYADRSDFIRSAMRTLFEQDSMLYEFLLDEVSKFKTQRKVRTLPPSMRDSLVVDMRTISRGWPKDHPRHKKR